MPLHIAVVGAGLGGATAAALLQRAGFDVTVYEQAPQFVRLGAGIHIAPNMTKVLRGLGVERPVVTEGFLPAAYSSRAWDTHDLMYQFPLNPDVEARYGAPYLTVNRGDLHAALVSAVKPGTLKLGKRLVGLEPGASSVTLSFADGSKADADIVIGADGLNSRVREVLHGPVRPHYSGYVAYRSTTPIARLDMAVVEDLTKWWGPDSHVISYFQTPARDLIYFVAVAPEAEWTTDASFVPAGHDELHRVFSDYHPVVVRMLDRCGELTKWGLFERPSDTKWGEGRIILLGDACHPMQPHLGQGAAMALEDAVVLARCLQASGLEDYKTAFRRYVNNRAARTAEVQRQSAENTWMREPHDPAWLYRYDAFTAPLEA
jgi:6-hydroxynicotinate 3-monooxygenase